MLPRCTKLLVTVVTVTFAGESSNEMRHICLLPENLDGKAIICMRRVWASLVLRQALWRGYYDCRIPMTADPSELVLSSLHFSHYLQPQILCICTREQMGFPFPSSHAS